MRITRQDRINAESLLRASLIEGKQLIPRREDETFTDWCERWLEYRERMEPEDERARRLR